GCNRQYRNTVSVSIEKPVDEVKVSGATATSTNGQIAGKVSFRTSCKCSCFLVAHMIPVDGFIPAQCIRKAVERIAYHAVYALHSRASQGFDYKVRHCSCHL